MESASSLIHKLLLCGSSRPSKLDQTIWPSFDQKLFLEHELETPSMSLNKYCCMMMRISIDCKGCQRKLKRTLLSMKEVETHIIERQYGRVSVCGRFKPSDVAVKVQKRMNRRVGILDVQEFDGSGEQPRDQPPPQGPQAAYGHA